MTKLTDKEHWDSVYRNLDSADKVDSLSEKKNLDENTSFIKKLTKMLLGKKNEGKDSRFFSPYLLYIGKKAT